MLVKLVLFKLIIKQAKPIKNVVLKNYTSVLQFVILLTLIGKPP